MAESACRCQSTPTAYKLGLSRNQLFRKNQNAEISKPLSQNYFVRDFSQLTIREKCAIWREIITKFGIFNNSCFCVSLKNMENSDIARINSTDLQVH
jgi:hypothetical protein